MRLINFKLGDVSEVASKRDFITAEEYESGASETVPGDQGGGYSLQGLLDTAHYGADAATEEEDSWQVDAGASDSASDSSLCGPAFATYCLNCSERRHGDVCETCGHDSAVDPLTVAPTVENLPWCRPGADRDVAIVYDDRMTMHQKGDSSPHPERPDRLRAIMSRLLSSGLAARCKRVDCREATVDELLCVHSEQLVEKHKQVSDSVAMSPDNESLRISSDLYINKHTFQCAKLAAGGSAQVAALVARKEASAGAAIVRPPGHHAESGNAMGFCFFNNAAVAARVAQRNGAQKVMIVDWDVHHGNGTQNIFWDDPSVLYISLHRYDGGSFYPGTGGATEVGAGRGEGFTVNIPWDYDGMGDDDYVAAFNHVVLPIASEFKPDLTIVSAGFDAAEGDPLGGCRVTPKGYGRMTGLLRPVAPLVLLLEGGYNLRATTMSTEACVRVLLGEDLPASSQVSCPCPSPFAWLGIQQAIRVQCQYWTCLTSAADVANSWVGSPVRALSDGRNWPNVMAGGPAPVPRGSSSSSSREVGGPARRRAPRGLLRGRRHVVGRRERLVKSDWRYKLILTIHNNAMKALWRRKRQLPRQTSLGSIGSMMELCSIGSSGSQQSLRSCPPNAVFDSAHSGREKKMKRLHRLASL